MKIKPTPAPQQVRIIGGQWKRSKLNVLDRPGLRPTPDRLRETLFNWLGSDLSGWHVLDAFAGTGALGLEAASRGAAQATLLECEPSLAKQIQLSLDRLRGNNTVNVTVHCANALQWRPASNRPLFDLVFLDPPFALNLFDQALAKASIWLKPQGLVYLEAPQVITAWPASFELLRHSKAGQTHGHLLRYADAATDSEIPSV